MEENNTLQTVPMTVTNNELNTYRENGSHESPKREDKS